MDTSSPLLNELEAIRQLLDQDQPEPPLLSDMLEASNIPVLSDIIEPGPGLALAATPALAAQGASTALSALAYPAQPAAALGKDTEQHLLNRVSAELRASAELILQDVIDDFVPKIEAELHRRLDARLGRLLKQP